MSAGKLPIPLSRGFFFSAVLCLALCCGPSSTSAPPEAGSTWLARSGDRVITVQEFQAFLDQQCARNPILVLTPSRKKELLEKYLEKTLLMGEAEKLGLNQDPKVLEDLKDAKDQILIKHLLAHKAAEMGGQIEVTDKEINSYYEDMHRQIRFRYVAAPSPDQAKVLLAKWQAGHPPPGVVDSGVINLAGMEEVWKKRLLELPLQKPQVAQVGSDTVLVEIIAKEEMPCQPLAQLRADIIKELTDRKTKEMLQQWVNQVKAKDRIEINESYKWD